MDWIVGLLPLLVLAACPLMMVVCFVGMRRMGGSTESAPAATTATTPAESLSPAEQIAALRAQLSHLQFDQLLIARQIDELEAATEAPTATGNDAVVAVPAGTSS